MKIRRAAARPEVRALGFGDSARPLCWKGWIGIACMASLVGAYGAYGAQSTDAGRKEPRANADSVTFTREIAPILFKHCASCHRPGEVAPFSLLTYRDAAKRAKLLALMTKTREMPPWKAVHGYGEFKEERRLTDREIDLIQRWSQANAPEGSSEELPPAPKFVSDWALGKPDLILTLPRAYTVKADGPDTSAVSVMPLNIPDDVFVSAFEFRPGNPRVVHHALLSLDTTGEARRKETLEPRIGLVGIGGPDVNFAALLGVWAPGLRPTHWPDGVGRKLPKGADLVCQIHYHPSGKEETDQSTIGLYFAKEPPKKLATYIGLTQSNLHIPPEKKSYLVSATQTVTADEQVIGIMPHMHLLGQEMQVRAILPDGTVKQLIWVNEWDFQWQNLYLFQQPVFLPKGTSLRMQARFDNSANNPRNPNHPPKWVHFGQNTTDEMAECLLWVMPSITPE